MTNIDYTRLGELISPLIEELKSKNITDLAKASEEVLSKLFTDKEKASEVLRDVLGIDPNAPVVMDVRYANEIGTYVPWEFPMPNPIAEGETEDSYYAIGENYYEKKSIAPTGNRVNHIRVMFYGVDFPAITYELVKAIVKLVKDKLGLDGDVDSISTKLTSDIISALAERYVKNLNEGYYNIVRVLAPLYVFYIEKPPLDSAVRIGITAPQDVTLIESLPIGTVTWIGENADLKGITLSGSQAVALAVILYNKGLISREDLHRVALSYLYTSSDYDINPPLEEYANEVMKTLERRTVPAEVDMLYEKIMRIISPVDEAIKNVMKENITV